MNTPCCLSHLSFGDNFSIVDKIEILIDEGELKVSRESLAINKIELNVHRKLADAPRNAINKMKTFLNNHFLSGEKITLAGHNINFDVNFLRKFLQRNHEDFNLYFSHRFIDTSSILYFLYLAGKINEKAISSDKAFKLFKIKIARRHCALDDAVATAELFTRLLEIVRKKLKVNLDKEYIKQFPLFDNVRHSARERTVNNLTSL